MVTELAAQPVPHPATQVDRRNRGKVKNNDDELQDIVTRQKKTGRACVPTTAEVWSSTCNHNSHNRHERLSDNPARGPVQLFSHKL